MTALTRRSSKGARRRAEILDATITLAGSSGLEAATMQRVADAAGVRKSLVLYHFGDRAGLVAALLTRCGLLLAERRLAALDIAGEDPREQLRAWIDAAFADPLALHARAVLLQAGARLVPLPGAAAVHEALVLDRERLAALLSRGNRAFTWQVSSPRHAAETVQALADGVCIARLRGGESRPEEFAARVRRAVLDYLV